jgi:hypothetical protein
MMQGQLRSLTLCLTDDQADVSAQQWTKLVSFHVLDHVTA